MPGLPVSIKLGPCEMMVSDAPSLRRSSRGAKNRGALQRVGVDNRRKATFALRRRNRRFFVGLRARARDRVEQDHDITFVFRPGRLAFSTTHPPPLEYDVAGASKSKAELMSRLSPWPCMSVTSLRPLVDEEARSAPTFGWFSYVTEFWRKPAASWFFPVAGGANDQPRRLAPCPRGKEVQPRAAGLCSLVVFFPL